MRRQKENIRDSRKRIKSDSMKKLKHSAEDQEHNYLIVYNQASILHEEVEALILSAITSHPNEHSLASFSLPKTCVNNLNKVSVSQQRLVWQSAK